MNWKFKCVFHDYSLRGLEASYTSEISEVKVIPTAGVNQTSESYQMGNKGSTGILPELRLRAASPQDG